MIDDLIVNSIKRGLKSSEFHYLLAKKNLYCSSFEEAKSQIDQAINSEKNILKYYKLAIKILQNYNAEHLASPYLEMIIKLDPNDGNAYYLLSKLITQKENYKKKISLLEVTNDLISDHHQSQFVLAVSHPRHVSLQTFRMLIDPPLDRLAQLWGQFAGKSEGGKQERPPPPKIPKKQRPHPKPKGCRPKKKNIEILI